MSAAQRPFNLLSIAVRRRSVWLGMPLLLYVWTLGGPFLFDDLHLLLKTERYLQGDSDHLDLYRFAPTDDQWRALRDRGTYPWWSPQRMRIDLFRPLAEWSFYLDVRLFGRNAIGHRLVSLIWFAVALVCLHQLYVAACGDAAMAGAATFFFGISQTAAQPVTFISNRSDLLATVGLCLAAWAYWKTYRPLPANGHPESVPDPQVAIGSLPSAAGNPQSAICNPKSHPTTWHASVLVTFAGLAYAFALLSKETTVALAAVLVVHWLLSRGRRPRVVHSDDQSGGAAAAAPGHSATAPMACRSRVLAACPALVGLVCVLAAAYLAYYVVTRPWHLGLGEYAADRGSVLVHAATSLPRYLAVWTVGFPISLLLQAPGHWTLVVGVAGCVLAVLTGWRLRMTIRRDPAAAFFALWAAMFLLPALLTNPETRVLCPATIGWAYLLARLLVPAGSHQPSAISHQPSAGSHQPSAISRRSSPAGDSSSVAGDQPDAANSLFAIRYSPFSSPTSRYVVAPAPLWLRHWLLAANGAISIACAVGTILVSNAAENHAVAAVKDYVAALTGPLADGDTLIVAEPQSPFEYICAGDRLEFITGRRDVALVFLTSPGTNAMVERLDDHTLRLRATSAPLLGSAMHRLILGPTWQPHRGDRFEHRDFTAEVVAVGADNTVTELRFRFVSPLTSPHLRFCPLDLAKIARGPAG